MKLYLISQDADNNYDNYTAAVVCAKSDDEAKKIHPDGRLFPDWGYNDNWVKSPDMVNVKYLGIADGSINTGVVLHSYKG